MTTDLSAYNNSWYQPGSAFKRLLWHYTSLIFFENGFFPIYGLKTFILRLFGSAIGEGVLIKPNVHIKYPWNLKIKNHVWIGENVWIDNLAIVEIGSQVCISQDAYLLTGNHNYKSPDFNLMIGSIKLEDGVWLGARSIVCPGIICFSHSILSVGSVATKNLETFHIYQGNPAIKIKRREFLDC